MSDSYTVLARRYRSQSFDQLIGQDAIAQTLKNAITSNRVAHAFLFTGTRGVGKTSAARILAKALNCPNAKDGVPCNTCDTCKAIARGEDMDVIEIDGASNNGVDQVRELRQSAGIRPARSQYKIYIIDEVHMLSTGAFNALLKTLEEPPSHVKFIFATTDVHKVPATIISRVQRFDFKNIPTAKIADHLKNVVRDEGVAADDDAIHRIARLGNGSMRDALSILDRVLSLGEKKITEKLLEDLLGKPATAAVGELVAAIADGDAGLALKRADAMLAEGMGAEQLLSEMVEFLRNLMLVSACGDKTDLLDVPSESRPIFTSLAAKFDAPSLVHLIALCEQTLRSLKSSTMGRPLFDALLVRLSLSDQFSSIRQILSDAPQTAPAAAPAASSAQKKNDIAPPAAPPAQAADEAPPPEDDREESIYDIMKQHMARKDDERNAAWAARQAGQPQEIPPSAPESAPEASEPLSFAAQMKNQLAQAARPQPQRPMGGRPGPIQQPQTAAPSPAVEIIADIANLEAVWQAAQNHLAANKARSVVDMIGGSARLENFSPDAATLCIPSKLKNYVGEKIRTRIEESLRIVTAKNPKLAISYYELAEDDSLRPPSGAATTIARVPPKVEEAVRNSPVITNILEKLGGDVSSIELIEQNEE
jgi:DNA polymerase-3 subunit gamma/tau